MSGAEEYVKLVQTDSFEKTMSIFIKENLYCNANLQYWWNYLEMVTILLMFTRAQREGQWDLHLHSFTRLVPFFIRYDHYNYSRWGPIYITEMHQLPPQLIYLFKQGDFVVKRSTRKFNEVDPDQAQEWLNGTEKRGGGIIGITRTPTTLARWSLSYNLRSQISADTRIMFGIRDDSFVHNETTTSRQTEDNKVEDNLLSILERFHVFSDKDDIQEILQCIATKDLATDEIQESLLKAGDLGQEQLDTFVSQMLLKDATVNECSVKKSVHDPIKKNKAPTFNNLYDVRKDAKVKDKQFAMKVDRSILQRLIAAYAAGREVDLATVLQHELMPVPISLAETNGDLRTGSKVILADCLTTGINCPSAVTLRGTSCLLIDGQALVCAIGKPAGCKTFGDLAPSFVTRIKNASASYHRVDIVFDRYRNDSIKASTRKRRAKATRPVRRIIESCDVPLPVNWANFTALSDNKAELTLLLSTEMIKHAPVQQTVIVSGGFADQCKVRTNNQSLSLDMLEATHEEVDMRLILHAIHSKHTTVVVKARDTDVLLLLIAHVDKMRCHYLWLEAGTAKKQNTFL